MRKALVYCSAWSYRFQDGSVNQIRIVEQILHLLPYIIAMLRCAWNEWQTANSAVRFAVYFVSRIEDVSTGNNSFRCIGLSSVSRIIPLILNVVTVPVHSVDIF